VVSSIARSPVAPLAASAIAWARAAPNSVSCPISSARVTPISAGRYGLELPPDSAPDAFLAELVAAGASIVSLNPLRETLEDFFVERVTRAASDARH